MPLHHAPSPEKRHWYLVRSKPRQEVRAQAHLAEQHYKTYLPQCVIKRRRRGRLKANEEPMFPGYLFIRLDQLMDNWAPIRSTPGVSQLVRFGQLPMPVSDSLIASLRAREDEHGFHRIETPDYCEGEKVLITDGSMAGLDAVFCAKQGEERSIILLNFLGTQAKTLLENWQFEKA